MDKALGEFQQQGEINPGISNPTNFGNTNINKRIDRVNLQAGGFHGINFEDERFVNMLKAQEEQLESQRQAFAERAEKLNKSLMQYQHFNNPEGDLVYRIGDKKNGANVHIESEKVWLETPDKQQATILNGKDGVINVGPSSKTQLQTGDTIRLGKTSVTFMGLTNEGTAIFED